MLKMPQTFKYKYVLYICVSYPFQEFVEGARGLWNHIENARD